MYSAVKKRGMHAGGLSNIIFICIVVSVFCHIGMVIYGILSEYSSNFKLFVNTYILFFLIILYIISRGINKHFLILSFFVCFFIFLMGQKFFVVLDGGEYNRFLTFKALELNGSEYFTFINLLYLSLLSIFIGYFMTKTKKVPKAKCGCQNNAKTIAATRSIVRVFYYITFVCALIMQIEILRAKSGMSYTDGYLINVDVNPLIKIGNYLFLGMAFLYLSCRPPKKEMLLILFTFIFVEGFLQLFNGRRALLAQSVFFIIWFYICYSKADEKRFTLKRFLLLCVLGLLLILLFGVVEVLRSGENFSPAPILDMVKSFFISTGGSDSTIANTIHYAGEFPKAGYVYFFDPLKDAIFNNVAIRHLVSLFTGADSASAAQGLGYLSQHNTFSHWLSYIVNPELYLNGYGMGSSFIAETYFAFGTIGVILFGLFLGFFIRKLSKFDNASNKIYKKAMGLFFVYNLFVLPRGSVLAPATDFLYFLTALLIVKIVSGILVPKHRSIPRGVKRERI